VNAQPWRALWLLGLVANAWTAVLALRLPPASASRRFLLVAMACGASEGWLDLSPALSAVAFGSALLTVWREHPRREPLPAASRRAWSVAMAAVVAPLIAVLWSRLPASAAVFGGVALAATAAVTAIAPAALVLSTRPLPVRSIAVWCAGFALLLCAAGGVDRRSEWQAFVERETIRSDLQAFVAGAETIYWERGVDLL